MKSVEKQWVWMKPVYWVLMASLALAPTATMAGDSEGKATVAKKKKLDREINKIDKQIKELKEEKKKVDNGKFDDQFNGDCNVCRTSCSERYFLAILNIPQQSTVNLDQEIERAGSSACELIYDKNPERKGLVGACKKAVERCAPIAKQLRSEQIQKDIDSLVEDRKDKVAKLEELEDQLADESPCALCAAMGGSAGIGFNAAIFGNLQSSMGSYLNLGIQSQVQAQQLQFQAQAAYQYAAQLNAQIGLYASMMGPGYLSPFSAPGFAQVGLNGQLGINLGVNPWLGANLGGYGYLNAMAGYNPYLAYTSPMIGYPGWGAPLMGQAGFSGYLGANAAMGAWNRPAPYLAYAPAGYGYGNGGCFGPVAAYGNGGFTGYAGIPAGPGMGWGSNGWGNGGFNSWGLQQQRLGMYQDDISIAAGQYNDAIARAQMGGGPRIF